MLYLGHTFMRFYTEETPFRNNPLPALMDILTSSSMRLIRNVFNIIYF